MASHTLCCTFDNGLTIKFGNDDGDGWILSETKLEEKLVVDGKKAALSHDAGSFIYETEDNFINPNDYIGKEVRLGDKVAVIEWEGEPPAKRRKRKQEVYVVSWYSMGYKPSRTDGGVNGVFPTWDDAMAYALKESGRSTEPTEDSGDAIVIPKDIAYWWYEGDTKRIKVSLQFMSTS